MPTQFSSFRKPQWGRGLAISLLTLVICITLVELTSWLALRWGAKPRQVPSIKTEAIAPRSGRKFDLAAQSGNSQSGLTWAPSHAAHAGPDWSGDLFRKIQDFYILDHWLGYKVQPFSVASRKAWDAAGRTAFDLQYHFDSFGRRVTPAPQNPNKHLLIFGCSFAFGEGVQDDQPVSAVIAKRRPDLEVLNYSLSGYSPIQAMALLRHENLPSQVSAKSGSAVFVMIGHHLLRVVSAMSVVGNWGGALPSVFIDETGQVIEEGPFREAHWLRLQVYKLLVKSHFFKWIGFDIPMSLGPSEIKLIVSIFLEARRLYAEQFGSERFYVAFYPSNSALGVLIPEFERAGLYYLDYSDLDLDQLTDGRGWLPDWHPSPEAHEILASLLLRDLPL